MSEIKEKNYSPDYAAESYIKTMKRITHRNYRWQVMTIVLFFSVLLSPGKFPLVMILQLEMILSYYKRFFEARI